MVKSRNIVALSVLTFMATWGCVSSPVVAPSDGQLFLSANPVTVVLDEFAVPPLTIASVVISAQLLSMNGVPQSGVDLVFTTDGGTLASTPPGQGTVPLQTDDNGLVSDTLTLQLGDPATTTITVRSGSLTQTIAISKTEMSQNQPPFPVININPAGTVLVGQTVAYDGSGTADPDGDSITCYQWQIETSETITATGIPCVQPNLACEIEQGMFKQIIFRDYIEEMASVQVTLRVTDDPSVACIPGGPALPETAFGAVTSDFHDVVCDRFMPMAVIGLSPTIGRTCAMSATPCTTDATCSAINPGDVCDPEVVASLSGAASTGGDSGIDEYHWDCGNSTPALDCPGGPVCPLLGDPTANCCEGTNRVKCVYSPTSFPQTFAVNLTVTNGCNRDSAVDSATVTVN